MLHSSRNARIDRSAIQKHEYEAADPYGDHGGGTVCDLSDVCGYFISGIDHLSLLLFALVFERREVIAAAGIFALLQLLLHGIMLWNIAYLIIFPTYALLFSLSRNWLRKHEGIIPFYCACFSFLCGQLVDLPFLLFDARVTMLYVLMGMKTSLIQAGLTFIAALFLYEPLFHVLTRIKKQVG